MESFTAAAVNCVLWGWGADFNACKKKLESLNYFEILVIKLDMKNKSAPVGNEPS